MKRIAFINTDAMSFNNLMRGQLEYLHSLGAELDLFCGGPRAEQEALIARNIGRVRHVPFRRPPHLLWDLVSLIWLSALLAGKRYDTVVYSTPKALLLGALAAWLTRQRRRIAWFRGRAYENMTGLKRRMYTLFDAITFSCSHRVLFVSPSLRDAYLADGLDARTKSLIVGSGSSNGVNLERFKALPAGDERDRGRAELGLSPQDFVVILVGRIAPDKGVDKAIELARRVPDLPHLRMLFVGTIEDERLGGLIQSPADPRVSWHGPTRQAERLFQIADLHLLLSSREGLPNVALEAAATNVPTIAWDVVGVRDAVVPPVTGLLLPYGDMDALERVVREAAADPPAFRNRFSGARQVVAERFDQPKVWRANAAIFLADGLALGA